MNDNVEEFHLQAKKIQATLSSFHSDGHTSRFHDLRLILSSVFILPLIPLQEMLQAVICFLQTATHC